MLPLTGLVQPATRLSCYLAVCLQCEAETHESLSLVCSVRSGCTMGLVPQAMGDHMQEAVMLGAHRRFWKPMGLPVQHCPDFCVGSVSDGWRSSCPFLPHRVRNVKKVCDGPWSMSVWSEWSTSSIFTDPGKS